MISPIPMTNFLPSLSIKKKIIHNSFYWSHFCFCFSLQDGQRALQISYKSYKNKT
jgi:hypothetical protein